jgi:malonyl-CoA/methylmalonyl-CoA synthetase
MAADALLPTVRDPVAGEAVRFPDGALTYEQLHSAATAVAARAAGLSRLAVWTEPCVETCVAVVGGLLSGAALVPLNPRLGARELAHVLGDSAPDALLAPEGVELPEPLAALPRIPVGGEAADASPPAEAAPEAPGLIIYTSGTTGPPKGVVLARRALAANLDALAAAWEWTAGDVLVHGLPLFHAHGLVLGLLGPLRIGGRLRHLGRFSVEGVCGELADGATMLFGVPTMYHRLAEAAEGGDGVARALGSARLLVSGSAPLPVRDHERIRQATGQRIAERYGLTETLMNCAATAAGPRRAGYVGPPLPGVEVRLVDESGVDVTGADDETIGEIVVRGPNLFSEYLNRPDVTAAAVRDGWFWTGDLATRAPDGAIRILGRRATDLIKTGGYKVGAGEIEAALLEHPGVEEVAVTGEPDDDLGERVVAWIVPRGPAPPERELADHVAALLAPHKRPRAVHYLDALPRNELGKVRKTELAVAEAPPGRVLALGSLTPTLAPGAFVAAGALLVGDVRLGPRSSVWYGSVLRADNDRIEVGEDSNLQDGCIVHADPGEPVTIGDRVTVGHGAIVHAAHIESDTLIGMGAIVLNGARVGAGSIVAAGAVVRPGTDVPPGSLVAGVPAQIRRPTTETERADIAANHAEYVAQAARHRTAREARV